MCTLMGHNPKNISGRKQHVKGISLSGAGPSAVRRNPSRLGGAYRCDRACLIFHILVFCCNHTHFGKAVGADFSVDGGEKQPPPSLSEHANGPTFLPLLGSLLKITWTD